MALDRAAEEQLLTVFAELDALRRHLKRLEFDLARILHTVGATWEQIGEAQVPPVSRQTAQKRFSHPKPRRRPRDGE